MALSLLKCTPCSFSGPLGNCEMLTVDVNMTSWFSESTYVQGSGLSSCSAGAREHACLYASTPASSARQISPEVTAVVRLKTCDRSVAQRLGKEKLTNWQVLGFGAAPFKSSFGCNLHQAVLSSTPPSATCITDITLTVAEVRMPNGRRWAAYNTARAPNGCTFQPSMEQADIVGTTLLEAAHRTHLWSKADRCQLSVLRVR